MSTQPQIQVHFSPAIIARIGKSDTKGWAEALRDWHHKDDPDYNFGRNVSNSRGVENTWAWHLHMAPDPSTTSEEDLLKWEKTSNSYYRTSDRLLVYSMSQEKPLQYGMLLLALLDPKGHDMLTKGVAASERRSLWEDLAYTHQMSGNMPDGTLTEP